MDISLDREFFDRSESIIRQFGFKDLKSFVKNQALLILMAKIDKFQTEIRQFENKYGTDFNRFQQRIEQLENREDFGEEDDYLDWRFAEEALKRLQKQTVEMKNA